MNNSYALKDEMIDDVRGGVILAMIPSDRRGRIVYRVIGTNGYLTNYTYNTQEEAEAVARFLGACTDVIYTED